MLDQPAEPDIERYKTNHRLLAGRLTWLWGRYLEYQGTQTHHRADMEAFVLQVRLACEQYALLIQSACYASLPGSTRKKSKQFDAVRILAEIRENVPHLIIIPLADFQLGESLGLSLSYSRTWKVDEVLFKAVYERSGNFLHATNRDFDLVGFQEYLNNAVHLVAQLILVTWRHVAVLDGLARQVVSQMLPDGRHLFFILRARDEFADDARAVLRRDVKP